MASARLAQHRPEVQPVDGIFAETKRMERVEQLRQAQDIRMQREQFGKHRRAGTACADDEKRSLRRSRHDRSSLDERPNVPNSLLIIAAFAQRACRLRNQSTAVLAVPTRFASRLIGSLAIHGIHLIGYRGLSPKTKFQGTSVFKLRKRALNVPANAKPAHPTCAAQRSGSD